MRIYVASSWRNERQPEVVAALREDGHEVYDFRHPEPGCEGFQWYEVDPAWQAWTPELFRLALDHQAAREGFARDLVAMVQAKVVVLVMPCGRSAHLELGWATGMRKATAILLSDGEPELMYRLADELCVNLDELRFWARKVARGEPSRRAQPSCCGWTGR